MTVKEINSYLTTRSWLYEAEQQDEINGGKQVMWGYWVGNDVAAGYIIHFENKKIISNNYMFDKEAQYQLFLQQLKNMGLKKGRTLNDVDMQMTEYVGSGLLFQLSKNRNHSDEPNYALMIRPTY